MIFPQVAASVAVPLWQNILLRIGKRATVFIGLSVRNQTSLISTLSVLLLPARPVLFLSQLFIPAVATIACVPSNLPAFMFVCILMGFSVATMFLLPWWVSFHQDTKFPVPSEAPVRCNQPQHWVQCTWIIHIASTWPGQWWILKQWAWGFFYVCFWYIVCLSVALR